MQSRVSLAELIDSDLVLRPDEAVAIVREICRQHAEGELRGIPNATVIRLTPDGRIVVEGPVSRDHAPVPAAAALLSDLLPGFHSAGGFKVPGGLRLVLARATRALDLPPFAGLSDFCAALQRFAAPDPADTVRRLFQAWTSRQARREASTQAGELTISDVRRARRATGLSLEDVAHASGIPAVRLRELEWGYLRNWSADEKGREELRCYARAAGVDEDLVLSIAWPLVESAAAEPVVEAVPERAPGKWELVPLPPRDVIAAPIARRPGPPPSFVARHRWLLALAAAVMLVVTALAMGWDRAEPAAEGEARRAAADLRPAPTSGQAGVEPAPLHRAGIEPASLNPAGVQPASIDNDARPATLAGTSSPPAPTRARARAAAREKPRPAPQHKSFFKRELFRIKIK